jgi:hypothetical protein
LLVSSERIPQYLKSISPKEVKPHLIEWLFALHNSHFFVEAGEAA